MRLIVYALMFMGATSATARDVVVRAGEHTGFTRIVLQDASLQAWQLGRSGDSYSLRISPADVRFDLSRIYSRITRKRLASARSDPLTGELTLDMACPCHAKAEEIRPGLLVIDLADGAPPAASAFERPLSSAEQERPRARPSTYDYDWKAPVAPFADVPLPLEDPSLSLMRQSLLEELSRGAATGAVEITEPVQTPTPAPLNEADAASLPQVRIGEMPGFAPRTAQRQEDLLTARGANCLADDQLDVENWGTDKPVAESIALASANLTGEFDRPQPDAVLKAVRFYLFLGFGTEAQQILHNFRTPGDDMQLLEAMARILDSLPQSRNVLSGMEVCDTSAALWAVLAKEDVRGASVQIPAILRSFSALPIHLRRHLGPRLAQIFLDSGDATNARAVRDAVVRGPASPDPQIKLMEAKVDIAEGNTAEGERALKRLSNASGPAEPEATLALAERTISTGQEISADTVTALASLLDSSRGGPLESRLRATYRHALAASGDVDSAFALSDPKEVDIPLWKILAERGSDTAFLAHSVLPQATPVPELPGELRRTIASRLLDLGFTPAAAQWAALGPEATDDDRILQAQIALKQDDARTALQSIAGIESREANRVRGEASLAMGDTAAAKAAFARADDIAGNIKAARVAGDWLAVATEDNGAWKAAATQALAPKGDETPLETAMTPGLTGSAEPHPALGPLARGRETLADSASARQALTTLLETVPAAAP